MSRVFSWSNDRLIRARLFFSSSGLLLYNHRSTSLKPTARQWPIKKIVMRAKGVWRVDTSPDLGGQNALKIFEMAIRHDRRPTRTELESFLSLNLFSLTFKNIIWPSYGGGGALWQGWPSPKSPLLSSDCCMHLVGVEVSTAGLHHHTSRCACLRTTCNHYYWLRM